jgi:1-deoxy-D-xylulose-5-phosphate synthase
VTVADARFAKPLDTALIDLLLEDHPALITLETGATGGFGALVLHHLANSGGLEKGRAIRTMTLPDRFIDQASPAQMYQWAGLTAVDIAATVRAATGRAQTAARPGLRIV